MVSPIYNVKIDTVSYFQQYYATGMCGTGGYCSAGVAGGPDPSQYQDQEMCECPPTDKLTNGECSNKYQTKWTRVTGSVVLVGNGFNPFGYGLAFPKHANVSDHVSFGQAINWIKDRGTIEVLAQQYVPDIATLACSSSVGSEAIVLGFQNIRGLLIVTGVVIFAGVGLGMAENLIWLAMYCCGLCSGKRDEDEMDDIQKLDEELNKKVRYSHAHLSPFSPLLSSLRPPVCHMHAHTHTHTLCPCLPLSPAIPNL